VGEFKASYLEL